MKKIKFQKSDILKILYDNQDGFRVPKLVDVYYNEFINNDHIDIISKNLSSDKLIVRSSSENEDGLETSNAGKYESILNLNFDDKHSITDAIRKVFDSYESNNSKSRVIVQEMIVEPKISGVLFTYELETTSPYYVINYDDISKKTDTVTSGNDKNSNKCLFVLRKKHHEMNSSRFKNLIDAVINIEEFLNLSYLDIEFAIDDNECIYIFQVRPILELIRNLNLVIL